MWPRKGLLAMSDRLGCRKSRRCSDWHWRRDFSDDLCLYSLCELPPFEGQEERAQRILTQSAATLAWMEAAELQLSQER